MGADLPSEPLHARGQRHDWSTLPRTIVAGLEAFLGASIVTATTFTGGYSPGIAARVETSSGRAVFVKAVTSKVNADAARFHRREIAVATALSTVPGLPVPCLLWHYDEPDSPWVALAFELIEGAQPAQPWRDDELDQVVDAMDRLASRLTPSPIRDGSIRTTATDEVFSVNHWRRHIEQPLPGLDPWCQRHLETLAALADQAATATAGDTLLHGDLRADNMVIGPDGVKFVDWPHALIGAAWIDPLGMAPSVEMHGGPTCADFFARFAAAEPADPEAVTIGIAAMTGFFLINALQPDIPALPGLRTFQRAQGEAALRWLQSRRS